jgi:hypothetical protein
VRPTRATVARGLRGARTCSLRGAWSSFLHRHRGLRRPACCRPPRSSSTYDVHKSLRAPVRAGQQPGDRAGGRGARRTRRSSGAWPRAWASPSRAFAESDEDSWRTALASTQAGQATAKFDWEAAEAAPAGSGSPCRERVSRRSREGGFPDAARASCEFYSAGARGDLGLDPVPVYVPPREGADSALAAGYPLAVPLAAGAQLPQLELRRTCKRLRDTGGRADGWRCTPRDAAARGYPRRRARCGCSTTRGELRPCARASPTAPRPGVVVAPSVWWKKYSLPTGRNANEVTSAGADRRIWARGATFYDCRVQVERAGAA